MVIPNDLEKAPLTNHQPPVVVQNTVHLKMGTCWDNHGFFGFLKRCYPLVEGSLEVKLPTIWTVEKQR